MKARTWLAVPIDVPAAVIGIPPWISATWLGELTEVRSAKKKLLSDDRKAVPVTAPIGVCPVTEVWTPGVSGDKVAVPLPIGAVKTPACRLPPENAVGAAA